MGAYLAFDRGAESGRAMLGEIAEGRLSVREIGRFPNEPVMVRGRLHWDVLGLFREMKNCLKRCVDEGVHLTSFAIDTWGVDYALLDGTGGLLGLPRAYRDAGGAAAMESFFAKVPAENVYGATGIQFLPFNTLFQLEAAIKEQPRLFEIADKLLFMPDLFNYLFTGTVNTEFTFATTSQLYNPVNLQWEPALFDGLGLPTSLMCDVVPAGTVD